MLAGCNSGCGRKEASKAHLWEGRPGQPGQAGEQWKGGDSLGTWQEAPPGRRQDVFACLGYYHFIAFVAWNFLHTNTNKNLIEKFLGSFMYFPSHCAHSNQEKITIMINYSPIVHRRYGLLHPCPGVQSLCLQG